MNDLPFLDDGQAEEPIAEAAAVEAPVEATPEAKGEPPVAPPATPEDHGRIPIAALLDEREKRKEKEREVEALNRRIADYEAKATPKPDFFADPDAALAAQARATQEAVLYAKLETSRFLAEEKFGAELVQEAFEFYDRNPHLSQPLLKSPSPYHAAVREYEKYKAAEEVAKDPSAYRARVEAEVRERILAEYNVQPKPTAPPPSLSSASSVSAGKAPAASGFGQLFGD